MVMTYGAKGPNFWCPLVAQWAGEKGSAGQIQPAGRTFDTSALAMQAALSTSRKLKEHRPVLALQASLHPLSPRTRSSPGAVLIGKLWTLLSCLHFLSWML